MKDIRLKFTYIGGPTALVEMRGLRLLADTADEAVETAHAFANAFIIPLHYEGWAHYSQSRQQIEDAFKAAGMKDRLRWVEPSRAIDITV